MVNIIVYILKNEVLIYINKCTISKVDYKYEFMDRTHANSYHANT